MNSQNQSTEINEDPIQDRVIELSSWRTAQELAVLFRIDEVNLDILLEKWKSEKKIFTVTYRDKELFPL